MDWDEARKPAAGATPLGASLDRLSVGDLEARVAELEAEIVRVKAEIEKKRAHSARAADIFKR